MRKLYSLIVLFTIVLLSSCAKDEVNPFGNIYGVVVNSNTSEPIQGARVTLTPTGKSTVTGSDGSYEFVDLEAGQYKVTVQADGYSSTLKNVSVVAGEKAIGDVSLSEKPQNSRLDVDKDIVFLTDGTKTDAIKIKNIGKSGDLEWTITNIPEWLTVTPIKGTTGVGKQSSVEISLKSSFTGSADKELIINAGNESVNITVTADTSTDDENGGNSEGGETDGDYSSAEIESCDPDIKVGISSCKRSGSTVIFKFYVINEKQSDISSFWMYPIGTIGSELVDDEKYYDYNNARIKFANKTCTGTYISTSLIKDSKTNGEITVSTVSNNITKFNVIKLSVECHDNNNTIIGDFITFRNVPIY